MVTGMLQELMESRGERLVAVGIREDNLQGDKIFKFNKENRITFPITKQKHVPSKRTNSFTKHIFNRYII